MTIEKRRVSGAPSVFIAAELLAEDSFGTWFLAPPGTPHVHGDGWVVHVQALPLVGLFPRQGRWTAWFNSQRVKIDLSLGVEVDLDRGVATFEDAELDILWPYEGDPVVVDRDEFDALHLDDARRSAMEEAAEAVVDAIVGRVEPFASVGRHLAPPPPVAAALVPDGLQVVADVRQHATVREAFGEAALADALSWCESGRGWLALALDGLDVVALVGVGGERSTVLSIRAAADHPELQPLLLTLAQCGSGFAAPPT